MQRERIPLVVSSVMDAMTDILDARGCSYSFVQLSLFVRSRVANARDVAFKNMLYGTSRRPALQSIAVSFDISVKELHDWAELFLKHY